MVPPVLGEMLCGCAKHAARYDCSPTFRARQEAMRGWVGGDTRFTRVANRQCSEVGFMMLGQNSCMALSRAVGRSDRTVEGARGYARVVRCGHR